MTTTPSGDTITTVDIGDTALHVEISGQGPPVLFVHGSFGDADVWADQARLLSDTHTCVRYDRRGHSRSGRGRAEIGVGRHADDVATLIDVLGLAPCLLVGSSFGATIAVDVAIRHGRLLRGVVFSEPPLFSLDPDAGAAVKQILTPIMRGADDGDGPAAVDEFFTAVCPGLWALLDENRKNRYRANADIGFADMRSGALQVAPRDLKAVDIPTLVVTGSATLPALRSVALRLATSLPAARLIELPGSGHVTYAERPAEFAEAVRALAAELDTFRRRQLERGAPCPRTA